MTICFVRAVRFYSSLHSCSQTRRSQYDYNILIESLSGDDIKSMQETVPSSIQLCHPALALQSPYWSQWRGSTNASQSDPSASCCHLAAHRFLSFRQDLRSLQHAEILRLPCSQYARQGACCDREAQQRQECIQQASSLLLALMRLSPQVVKDRTMSPT